MSQERKRSERDHIRRGFVTGQQHAFTAAIVVAVLALVASLTLIRVNKVAPPAPVAAPALAD
jgi:hypothetical protein